MFMEMAEEALNCQHSRAVATRPEAQELPARHTGDGSKSAVPRSAGAAGNGAGQPRPRRARYFFTLTYLPPITLRMALAPEPSPTSSMVVSPEIPS